MAVVFDEDYARTAISSVVAVIRLGRLVGFVFPAVSAFAPVSAIVSGVSGGASSTTTVAQPCGCPVASRPRDHHIMLA